MNSKFKMKAMGILFAMLCCLQFFCTQDASKKYKNGLVVSAHPVASKVGLDILKKGGNAVDASIAVHFALSVVYPNAGNIGGGGFALYRQADGKVYALDYREKAPLKSHKNMYLNSQGAVMKNKSTLGVLAAGVPGSVSGMFTLHEKFGSLAWSELLAPSVEIARNGFNITALQAQNFNQYQAIFKKMNLNNTYLQKKEGWKAGDLCKQEALALTLERIKENKLEGFYGGKTAELLLETMKKQKGIISMEDLKKYQSKWRRPIVFQYKDYTINSFPPPSSGGIVMGQILKMIEDYNIHHLPYHGTKHIQLLVEAQRRAYADRSKHIGDPDFYQVNSKSLLDSKYLKTKMNTFSFDKASDSKNIAPGKLWKKEPTETTHFTVIDKDGNTLAITTTLNGAYGSKVFVDGAGFLLNNEMDDFAIKLNHPNMFGLIGGKANSIQPEKRMLSSMTPSIIEKKGELFMTAGSPGGSTIITTVLQVFLNVVAFGMDVQAAVDAPRFHHQWLPDLVLLEKNKFDAHVLDSLKRKGYDFKTRQKIGQANSILVDRQGYYLAGADSRGDNYAAGY